MSKWQVLILGFTLVILVGLLAGGLQALEFRGGQLDIDPDEREEGGHALLPFPYAMAERILDLIPWLVLGAAILGIAVFRRKLLHRWRVNLMVFAAIVLLGVFALMILPAHVADQEPPADPEDELQNGEPAGSWGPGFPSQEPGLGDSSQESPIVVPRWVTYLVAMTLALPLVWLGWRLVRRATSPKPPTFSDELREISAQAVNDLRAGVSVEQVVIRCWAQMADILAPRAGGVAPAVTPRELAHLLASRGVRHDSVAELTRLFEEVRYGARADEARRERALAALAAIEEAYGTA